MSDQFPRHEKTVIPAHAVLTYKIPDSKLTLALPLVPHKHRACEYTKRVGDYSATSGKLGCGKVLHKTVRDPDGLRRAYRGEAEYRESATGTFPGRTGSPRRVSPGPASEAGARSATGIYSVS